MNICSEFKKFKFWAIITGILEIACLVHGHTSFPSLEYVLRRDGFFANNTEYEKENIFALTFASMSIAGSISKVILGLLIDSYGNWVARVFGHIVVGAGLLFLIMTNEKTAIMFTIGITLFNMSQGFIQSFYIMVNLYPNYRGLLIASAASANSFIARIFYVYYKNAKDTTNFWIFFFSLNIIFIFRTIFLTQKSNTPYTKSEITGKHEVKIGWSSRNGPLVNRETVLVQGLNTIPTFFSKESMSHIFNFQTLTIYVALAFADLRFAVLYAQVQPWFRWATEDNEKNQDQILSKGTEIFYYAGMIGGMLGPFLGIVLDKIITRVQNKNNIPHRKASFLVGLISMVVMSVSLTIISYLLTLGKSVDSWNNYLLWILFVLTAATNIFERIVRGLYVMSFSKPEYLGRIFGVMSLLQLIADSAPPVFTFMCQQWFDHSYGYLNWILVGTSLASAVLPMISLVLECKKER